HHFPRSRDHHRRRVGLLSRRGSLEGLRRLLLFAARHSVYLSLVAFALADDFSLRLNRPGLWTRFQGAKPMPEAPWTRLSSVTASGRARAAQVQPWPRAP